MSKNTLYVIPLVLLVLTFISFSILASTSVSADDVVDDVTITVPMSCTMTGTGQDSHTASINPGTYNSSIGLTTIKAFCNDHEGFAIYAIGYTDEEDGKNVLTSSALGSTSDIATSTATSGNNSAWAMKLSVPQSPTPTYPMTIQSDTEGSFSSFHTVPDDYTLVAKRTSSTDIGQNAEGSSLTTTYQAYISQTQPAGTYTGKVKYTMVHPHDAEAPLSPQQATPGCINYFANASDAVGTMGCQSATDGNTITLLASNFSRTGYGFAGWSNKYDYATSTAPDLKFYGPNEDITVPTGTTANGLSLYAVWVKSEGSIQDTNKVASLCGTNGVGGTLTTAPTDGTANLSSVSALTDQRDNQTYAIARLADGKCWMIENLRLEAEHTRSAEDQSLAQGYGSSSTYGSFEGLADAESANFSNSTTANNLYYSGTQSGTASINIGTSNYPGLRMPRYNNTNTLIRASIPTNNNENLYSYGNYYTWPAAIADTSYITVDHGTTSICPTGWKLPQGDDTTSDFAKLDVDIGGNGKDQSTRDASNRWRKYPNNFVYSGYYSDSSISDRGGTASNAGSGYWSSTPGGYSVRETIYTLLLYPARVRPNVGNSYKYSGITIRCTTVDL